MSVVTTGYPGKRSDLKSSSLLSEVVLSFQMKIRGFSLSPEPTLNTAHVPWSPLENVSWGTDISAEAIILACHSCWKPPFVVTCQLFSRCHGNKVEEQPTPLWVGNRWRHDPQAASGLAWEIQAECKCVEANCTLRSSREKEYYFL